MNEVKNSVPKSTEMVAIPLVKLDALIAAVELLKAGKLRPFMYAIQGPDGEAHIDENCVAADPGALAVEVNGLNDSPDTGFSIVPVYLGYSAPQSSEAPTPRQPMIGRLFDEFAALPVLWGLNEPGALVRHSQVFDMMVKVGKEYASVSHPMERSAPASAAELIDIIRGALADGVVQHHSPEWVARARSAIAWQGGGVLPLDGAYEAPKERKE